MCLMCLVVLIVLEAEAVLDLFEFVTPMIKQIVLTPREEHDLLLVTNPSVRDP